MIELIVLLNIAVWSFSVGMIFGAFLNERGMKRRYVLISKKKEQIPKWGDIYGSF